MKGKWGRGGRGGEGREEKRGIAHRFLLQVERGDVEGARSRPFPVHRHHAAVVTGKSIPDSVGDTRILLTCTANRILCKEAVHS